MQTSQGAHTAGGPAQGGGCPGKLASLLVVEADLVD